MIIRRKLEAGYNNNRADKGKTKRMPSIFKTVVDAVKDIEKPYRKNNGDRLMVTCRAVHVDNQIDPQGGKGVEWTLGSNFEDGFSTLIYRAGDTSQGVSGSWYYRDPFTGRDTPLKAGALEAVAHVECYLTEGFETDEQIKAKQDACPHLDVTDSLHGPNWCWDCDKEMDTPHTPHSPHR